MSKSAEIRRTLAGAAKPMTTEQVCAAIGEPTDAGRLKKVHDLLGYLRQRGEVSGDSSGWKAGSGKPPKQARPQRLKGFKAEGRERKVRSVRQIAQRIAQRPALSQLALDNFIVATAQLRDTILQEVEGLEHNDALRGAVENHKRAEAILNATRAA